MKNLISSFISLFIVLGLVPTDTFADDKNYDFYYQDFLVSAYYSPLPGQTRYLRKNYEAEIRLNGRGTNGADGTEVYMGMLAAPKSYGFGTHIDLPGLGVGSVHDRGGAIKEKQNYHRIDVWMGHGDIGLSRALNWGMRYITGKVYFEKNIMADNLDYTVIAANAPTVAKKKQVQQKVQVISKNLSPGMVDTQVVKLKEVLKELGYYSFETQNNFYGPELSAALIRFQKDKNIISNTQSYGAGYLGLKTREALNASVAEKNVAVSSPQEKKETQKLTIQSGIGKSSSADDVRKLQTMLAGLGYFNGALDGVYSEDLVASVFAFQKDNNVVSSPTQAGAGYFGPKTKKALSLALEKRQERLKNFPVSKSQILEGEKKEVKNKVAVLPQSISFPRTKSATFVPSSVIADVGEGS
jgi:peptidoglycan hydrolase-like protein with peptidoglycan-binding domain/3D (Asp-Asp-Asp) domain-containing protein